MTIFEKRVVSGLDDVEQAASGAMSLASSDLELSTDGNTVQTVGIRFTSIDIPQGAIITSAYLQFQTDEVGSSATSLLIRGEDVDDASAFANVANNVSSRTKTDAAASWSPAAWTTVGQAGLAQRTPDLSAVVQEIVSRAGWTALNDMDFIITGTGTRTAEAFESGAASAPLLHIEYVMPTGSNAAPTLDLDASATGAGYAATFTENAGGVAIADVDVLIADADDVNMERATLTLTNAQAGDQLLVNAAALPAGITVSSASTATTVILTGSATIADYQTALRQVSFNSTSETPATTARLINVTVNDGIVDSNIAVATIAIDRAPDALGDIATTVKNTAVTTGNVLLNDDPGDAPATITAFAAVSTSGGTVVNNGNGTFTYTPAAGFTGADTFGYTIADADGDTSSATVSVTVTSSAPTIFEKRVVSGLDDVEQAASGAMSLASSDLELSTDGNTVQTVGIRFTSIDIPQGAIITSAYLQFQTDEVGSSATSLLIRGEDVDDAAAFANVANNVSSRTKTDAAASWSPAAWTTVGEAGLAQRTPDLSAVVQEIVSRAGWTALNDMDFIITGTGTRTAEAFEGGAASAPLLHIEYVMPGPAGTPVAFNTPPDADTAVNQIAELAAAGAAVGITASATDPDAGSTVTYSLNDSRFAINSTGVITRSATGTLDFETQTSINLTVTATSSDGSTANQSFALAVLNSPEPVAFNTPADTDTAVNQIAQNAAAGTAIGITASATDPDAGSTVTYSLNDSRFAINSTGVITRSATGTLNAQTEPSVNLTVTATSSDGSIDTHAFTVGVVPTAAPQTLYRFAIFGDYGDTDLSGEKAVSAMVHGWNVDFILTVGDNVYAPQSLDAAVGQQYHDYIGNYQGAYGSGSTINRFFPALGNHEYDEGYVPTYLNYFTLPDNERYYDFQIGPVHFFALSSNKQEPDGRSSTSVQGHWLQSLLANSDASFDVAYFHHTAYNPSGSTATMQWPFEQWGVNAVFAGHQHNYYRENRDDNGDGVFLPYTTTGLGGAGRSVPNVGANLVTVTDAGMLIEFYKVSSFNGTTATSVLTDSYFVPTPAGRTPTIVNGGYVLNGTAGADYLWGLGGNDTLIGGRGNDMLVAGNQHNLFVFGVGDGQDTIANFLPGAGTGDVLDLTSLWHQQREPVPAGGHEPGLECRGVPGRRRPDHASRRSGGTVPQR